MGTIGLPKARQSANQPNRQADQPTNQRKEVMQTEAKPQVTAQEALDTVAKDAQSKVSDTTVRTPYLDKHGLKGRQGDVYYALAVEESVSTGYAKFDKEAKRVEIAKSHVLTREGGEPMTLKGHTARGGVKQVFVRVAPGETYLLAHPEHADHRISIGKAGILCLWPQVDPISMRQVWD